MRLFAMDSTESISVRQAREIDRLAQEKLGISATVLMENAGRSVARVAEDMLGAKKRVAIFCGQGNNGGDGFVCARHLLVKKKQADVYLVANIDQIKEPAKTNFNILINWGKKIYEIPDIALWRNLRHKIRNYDLIIDGLLGIGISGQVRPLLKSIIEDINNYQTPVLSIDTPSGLNADTGLPQGASIKADKTVTFVSNKKGFFKKTARFYTGQVIVKDLGFYYK